MIALMIKAATTSETSVNFYQTTRRNNPKEAIFIRHLTLKIRVTMCHFLHLGTLHEKKNSS
jgi:hypothetical protein